MSTAQATLNHPVAPDVTKLALYSNLGKFEEKVEGVGGLSSALKINTLLQTTLDPEKVIQLFANEVKNLVPYDSLTFRCATPKIEVKVGQAGRHGCSYRLVVREEQLGEIIFKRNKKFSSKEAELIENLLCGLIYPLRNALHYRTALQAAWRDALTGIGNRAAMDAAMSREIEISRRHNSSLSLLAIDIDHFKHINDSFGHTIGDDVLITLTHVIATIIRKTDMFFRYGGEEFVVVCNTGLEGGKLLAERIRKGIEKAKYAYNDHKLNLTVSIGVAVLGPEDSADMLFKKADQALYRAKSEGRNCVRCNQPLTADLAPA